MSGPSDTPEQVLILRLADGTQLAIRCHDVDGQQVVDREPVFATEPTLPAAQGQTCDSRSRHGADRRRETESLGFVIKLSPYDAGLCSNDPCNRIDANTL